MSLCAAVGLGRGCSRAGGSLLWGPVLDMGLDWWGGIWAVPQPFPVAFGLEAMMASLTFGEIGSKADFGPNSAENLHIKIAFSTGQ